MGSRIEIMNVTCVKMENLMASAWLLAVFAVSGSVAFIAVQAHKRRSSYFMAKMDFQFNRRYRRCEGTKRVRFAEDVVEPSSDNKDYRRRYHVARRKFEHRKGDGMLMNRQVLYEGIIQYGMVSRA